VWSQVWLRSYVTLQQMIEQKERHPVSYCVKMIQGVMVELEGEADIEQPIPFEEFQKWARALGIRKGWVKNDSY